MVLRAWSRMAIASRASEHSMRRSSRCAISPAQWPLSCASAASSTNRSIKVDDLYAAYKTWADANGHRTISKETSGRDLRAVVPGLRKSHLRRGGDQFWQYEGIDIDQNRGFS